MSAAQALASQKFLNAMGPMVYDEQKVSHVVSLINYMRENDNQWPIVSESELKNCMLLDEAMNHLREHI
ncbi:MAG: hypothetical protein MJZ79_02230 [Paludibacteraceae bacterium]|nr:hypothetical protein [Paludibacteraceae bacterium]